MMGSPGIDLLLFLDPLHCFPVKLSERVKDSTLPPIDLIQFVDIPQCPHVSKKILFQVFQRETARDRQRQRQRETKSEAQRDRYRGSSQVRDLSLVSLDKF
jgi:hypothetical protein